jgi:hypothetical protein
MLQTLPTSKALPRVYTRPRPPVAPVLTPLPAVRLATVADLPQCIELGVALHAENGLMPLDLDRITEAAYRAVRGEHAVCGVVGPVGAVEAMICLTIGQFWYTDKPHLEELFSYCRPEYRKSKNAQALIEFAKGIAARFQVPLLIGIVSNTRTETKVELYARRLGKPAGAYFLFGGHTGD